MWYYNNLFLVIIPDLYHPVLGWIVVIRHQENPGGFLEVESSLKVNLSHPNGTDILVKYHM